MYHRVTRFIGQTHKMHSKSLSTNSHLRTDNCEGINTGFCGIVLGYWLIIASNKYICSLPGQLEQVAMSSQILNIRKLEMTQLLWATCLTILSEIYINNLLCFTAMFLSNLINLKVRSTLRAYNMNCCL